LAWTSGWGHYGAGKRDLHLYELPDCGGRRHHNATGNFRLSSLADLKVVDGTMIVTDKAGLLDLARQMKIDTSKPLPEIIAAIEERFRHRVVLKDAGENELLRTDGT
jgi:hypothetical protein